MSYISVIVVSFHTCAQLDECFDAFEMYVWHADNNKLLFEGSVLVYKKLFYLLQNHKNIKMKMSGAEKETSTTENKGF